MLQYATTGHLALIFNDDQMQINNEKFILPKRMKGNELHKFVFISNFVVLCMLYLSTFIFNMQNYIRYSKVLDNNIRVKPLPTCPHLVWSHPHPLNCSASV